MTDLDRRDEIFFAALELPIEDRDAFVVKSCGSDPSLLEDVRSLLRADDGSKERLEHVIGAVAHTLLEAGGAGSEGRRIGPYRVERVLGTGGMGTVYLARRDDEAFDKRVAIKVIRWSSDSDEMRRRFVTERQILASLKHPYIARLLDGGTTDDGSPFVVMEHVEGVPIDEFCDARRSTLEDRLELFLRICDAVEAAHSRLVVHRDLKPDNVLISEDGSPHLIDFGIAKLLEPSGISTAQTRTAMRMLTPEYASPEQLRGEPVTVATDVYSLGVLLYELLTGRWPYPGTTDAALAREVAVLDAAPRPPSLAATRSDEGSRELAERRGATPERLARRLRGDLDTIVLTALRKEPDRRYATVQSFAADVRRYLERRPIRARPETLRYRSVRFVQRNWIGLTAASMVALSLAVGTVVAWNGLLRARRAQAVAEANVARADTINAFLTGMLSSVRPDQARGREVTVRSVLDTAAARLQEGPLIATQPEVAASLLFTIGESYLALGELDAAKPVLEEALALRERDLGPLDERVLETHIRLGEIAYQKGDGEGALASALRILEIRRATVGPLHEEYSAALLNVGNSYADLGRIDLAEPLVREAVSVDRQVLEGDDIELLGYTLNSLGTILVQQGRFDEAIPLHEEALDLRRRFSGDTSTVVVTSLTNLSAALQGAGRLEEAEDAARGALGRADAILDADHPRRAHALVSLGRILEQSGRAREAEPLFGDAVSIYEAQLGPESWRAGVALAYHATTLLGLGRAAEADRELRQAWATVNGALPPDHPQVVGLARDVARAFERSGAPGRAEEWWARAG